MNLKFYILRTIGFTSVAIAVIILAALCLVAIPVLCVIAVPALIGLLCLSKAEFDELVDDGEAHG
jgi:hypothetical protein